MRLLLPIGLVALLVFACNQPPAQPQKDYSQIDQEIAQLDSNVKLRKYLEEIGRLDQKFRSDETFIVQQHGQGSKEHQEIWQKINETDELNLIKVEKLLAKFGYPKADFLGSTAASAPFMVIHHSADYDSKKRNFHYLFEAYKSGNLKEGPFSLYLNRMYELKMGKRYEVGDVFKEEDRINGIIEELGLK